jgi:hypothetical protein
MKHKIWKKICRISKKIIYSKLNVKKKWHIGATINTIEKKVSKYFI